jgi:hypothetical protein
VNASARFAVRVGSAHAARAYIDDHRCDCAGPWTAISGTRGSLLAGQQGYETETVEVRCQACDSTATVLFSLPRKSLPVVPDPGQAGRRSREQHYLFAHRLLRDRLFADPEGFATVMRQAHARDWLIRLWGRAYEETGADSPALDADGLDVTWHEGGDAGCAIVTMPPTRETPEAVAVAVLATQGEWRYFPFERVSADDCRAVLCEWRADGSRRNHELRAGERLVPPEAPQCLAVLQEQLQGEGRQGGSQPPAGEGFWRPGEEQPSLAATLGTFWLQPCAFAFHVLPAAVTDLAEELADPDDQARLQVLLRLWRRAGDPGEDTPAGEPAPVTSSVREVGADKFLVIELPPPAAPPEPRFVAVRISAAGRPHCEMPLHTLELSSRQRGAPPVLGQISPALEHGITGCLPDSELDTFLSAVTGRVRPAAAADTMSQLLRYAMVKAATERETRGK